MVLKRCVPGLFVIACVVGSPSTIGDNIDKVQSSQSLRLAMLNQQVDTSRAGTESANTHPNNSDAITVIDTAASHNTLSDEELAALRKLFLKAEQAVKKKNSTQYHRLANQLGDYPLYPYLQYQWLKQHLDDDEAVQAFLFEHGDTRYAPILKRKWLKHMASQAEWNAFLLAYEPVRDTRLQCYYRRAQYSTGNEEAALAAAVDLWSVGKSQPKQCDPLFSRLKESTLFDSELKWKRFAAAIGNNKTRLARYIMKQLPEAERKTARLWLNLHYDPARFLPKLLTADTGAHSAAMFSHAVKRLARKEIYEAVDYWDDHARQFDVPAEQAAKLEKHLALKLAWENDAQAWERFEALDSHDNTSKTWRIRTALSSQNWPRVIDGINSLSAEQRQSEKWQYWLARAYMQTDNTVRAHEILGDLAQKRDFYGYLAADMLGRDYQLSHDPVDVSERDIDAVANRDAFRMAFEFMVLERETDAKSQWWHAVKQLDKTQIPAAAKLAQRWLWDEIAIFTIAKVEHWDDVELRFPMSYADKVREQAALYDLDPMFLFGLIRRESAFNDDAMSAAGARGLMQIMPRTGRQIARDLNERWRGSRSLFDADKNLRYGAYYYQKLLKQFDGHYAIALAAYNAGPNRVKQWLPDENLPADIWIETIPFNETRDYVTNVLVYAMIYQQLMDTDRMSMSELTREVVPPNDLALNTANRQQDEI